MTAAHGSEPAEDRGDPPEAITRTSPLGVYWHLGRLTSNHWGHRQGGTKVNQQSQGGAGDLRVAEAWQGSEEQYRTLFEMAPDVIYSISAEDGTFTALSPTFEAITGWSVDHWLGRPFASIIHPDDLPLAAEKFQQGLRGEVPPPYELRIRSRSGEYLVGEFRSRPLIEQGRVIGKIGIARDITARKRVEDALRFLASASETLVSSLDYQTTLTNVARLAVPHIADWCVVDVIAEDGSIQRVATAHANPEKERWAKEVERRYPPDNHGATAAVLATGHSLLVPEVSDDVLVRAARDVEHLSLLRQMGMCSAMTVPLIARGRVLGSITFIATESGRQFGTADLSLAEDLARSIALAVDNARLYEQAQEALRLRDEFLSIASHELRTPLTSLSLQVQLLERTISRLSPQGAVVERIARAFRGTERQLARLTRLSSDLLDVARIAAGRLELERETMDLSLLTREVVTRFEETLPSGSSQLRLDAETPVVGCWDRFRLDQVVTNLLSNALKYGKGKPVQIAVEADERTVHLSVRDQGIGIAPEDLPRIFDRFERAARRHADGLGLGLYICRQLVEGHGGTIQVTSEPGKGSTFRVELPLAGRPSRDAGEG